jgi:hypothetical protein
MPVHRTAGFLRTVSSGSPPVDGLADAHTVHPKQMITASINATIVKNQRFRIPVAELMMPPATMHNRARPATRGPARPGTVSVQNEPTATAARHTP